MSENNIVLIGGKEYVYPTWTMGPIQKIIPLSKELAELASDDITGQLRIMGKMLSIALIRDYPEVTEEFINNWLSMDEIDRISEMTVIQMDKMSKKKNMEMLIPETKTSTGEESTQESSLQQDGAGNT